MRLVALLPLGGGLLESPFGLEAAGNLEANADDVVLDAFGVGSRLRRHGGPPMLELRWAAVITIQEGLYGWRELECD